MATTTNNDGNLTSVSDSVIYIFAYLLLAPTIGYESWRYQDWRGYAAPTTWSWSKSVTLYTTWKTYPREHRQETLAKKYTLGERCPHQKYTLTGGTSPYPQHKLVPPLPPPPSGIWILSLCRWSHSVFATSIILLEVFYIQNVLVSDWLSFIIIRSYWLHGFSRLALSNQLDPP